MKKRVHKAHPLQIQMSLGLKLCFHRTELVLWQTQYEEAMELNLFHFSFVAPVSCTSHLLDSKPFLTNNGIERVSRCTNSAVFIPVIGDLFRMCFKYGFIFKQNLVDSEVVGHPN